MKFPECRLCGKTFENLTYDKMMAHVYIHQLDKHQKTMDDVFVESEYFNSLRKHRLDKNQKTFGDFEN